MTIQDLKADRALLQKLKEIRDMNSSNEKIFKIYKKQIHEVKGDKLVKYETPNAEGDPTEGEKQNNTAHPLDNESIEKDKETDV